MTIDLTALLARLGACDDAREWAATQPDAEAAWRTCTRGDWMLWIASRVCDLRLVVRAACACARPALPIWEARYPDDSRPRVAIETAEAWTRGEATIEQVRIARDAARAAARAAHAAGYAAYAYAAAYAARAAAYARAAADAASFAHSAELVRGIISYETIARAVEEDTCSR